MAAIDAKLGKTEQAADSALLNGQTVAQLPFLGAAQSWSRATRVVGTVYQNKTGKPIAVTVRLTTTTATLEISSDNSSWVIVGYGSQTSYLSVYAVVPNNHYYRATGGGGEWAELR